MDKHKTAKKLKGLEQEGIFVSPQRSYSLEKFKNFSHSKYEDFWKKLLQKLDCKIVIGKPQSDGCSSGVVVLSSGEDMRSYVHLLLSRATTAPPGSFSGQKNIIEMPQEAVQNILFEKYCETDELRAVNNTLKRKRVSGWIEVTVGVFEKNGKLHAFSPSITVSESRVLSVEEKFQGGTGVNITPPPPTIVSSENLKKAKRRIEKVAQELGISGYARIDAFLEVNTGNILVIEANTLPALTPSTVIFHQTLAENPKLFPLHFLEGIIKESVKVGS